MLIVFLFIFSACPENCETRKPATIVFENESGYFVNVYKNANPLRYDPSIVICTINPTDFKIVQEYASQDQVFGDAFYPQYRILLADSMETGTTDIFVDAQRVLTNLTFVIKDGGSYTKSIPKPAPGELSFFHAYLIVTNTEQTQIQILVGSTDISNSERIERIDKMDNGVVFLNPGETGYYVIKFSAFNNTLTMNQLNAYISAQNIEAPFPGFTVEKGKKYSFTVQGGVVTPTGVVNIIQ